MAEKIVHRTPRRINVSVARTINLGNYESIKLQAGLSEDIPDKADYDAEYSRMFDECLRQLATLKEDVVP